MFLYFLSSGWRGHGLVRSDFENWEMYTDGHTVGSVHLCVVCVSAVLFAQSLAHVCLASMCRTPGVFPPYRAEPGPALPMHTHTPGQPQDTHDAHLDALKTVHYLI